MHYAYFYNKMKEKFRVQINLTDVDCDRWNLYNSVFFSFTAMTTIGEDKIGFLIDSKNESTQGAGGLGVGVSGRRYTHYPIKNVQNFKVCKVDKKLFKKLYFYKYKKEKTNIYTFCEV